VVVIRQSEAEDVLRLTLERSEKERQWFEAIARGETILEDSDDDLIARGAEIVERL
jgi:regulator of RNase E activity RraA